MNIDFQNLMSDAQNLAQAVGTYYSSNVIDLWGLAAGQTVLPKDALGNSPVFDLGRGGDVNILAQVVTTFTTGAGGTLQVQLINADSADLLTNPTVLWDSGVIAVATLVAGYRFRVMEMPYGVVQRYIGFKFMIATGAMTAGNVTAAIVYDHDTAPGSMK
jgi:hypothetical protein